MNTSIALHNLEFLKGLTLDKIEKLYVSDDNLISFDERMFKSIRRYYDGSSRNDLIDPIQETFTCLLTQNPSIEMLCTYEKVIHLTEVYLKLLYTEQNYSQLFKSVIRQVKLSILDAKTHISRRSTYDFEHIKTANSIKTDSCTGFTINTESHTETPQVPLPITLDPTPAEQAITNKRDCHRRNRRRH